MIGAAPPPEKREPLALMASKVLLWARLPASAKTVGGILLDHVNWKPGENYRCDPGIERLCELSGLSRSNVQEALNRLAADAIIVIHVHGGIGRRNAYEFVWDEIRARDAATQIALKTGRQPPWVQGGCRPDSRAQTRVQNPKEEPVGQARRENGPARPTMSRRDAARQAAIARLDEDLRRLGTDVYEKIVSIMDDDLHVKAVEAEVESRGGGTTTVLRDLRHLVEGLPSPDQLNQSRSRHP